MWESACLLIFPIQVLSVSCSFHFPDLLAFAAAAGNFLGFRQFCWDLHGCWWKSWLHPADSVLGDLYVISGLLQSLPFPPSAFKGCTLISLKLQWRDRKCTSRVAFTSLYIPFRHTFLPSRAFRPSLDLTCSSVSFPVTLLSFLPPLIHTGTPQLHFLHPRLGCLDSSLQLPLWQRHQLPWIFSLSLLSLISNSTSIKFFYMLSLLC